MLADDRALDDVVFGAGSVGASHGIVDALEPGAVHVSMSTVGVATVRRIAALHEAHGNGFVSAPVFGRPEAAAAAKLWVIAAGPEAEIAAVRPVLDAVGQGVLVVGEEPWAANAVKLGGNFMIAAMMEALGEVFTFGRKSGVEPATFLEILNTALFKSPIYQNYGTTIAEGRFEPAGFRLRLGLKDMRLVLEAAEAVETPMPLASLLRDNFLGAVARGEGERDWAAIASVAARDAGLDS
jgi:3-hydroxyisobutyrate dehydrogenase-like beta-hydroxyacid dehydrogenase